MLRLLVILHADLANINVVVCVLGRLLTFCASYVMSLTWKLKLVSLVISLVYSRFLRSNHIIANAIIINDVYCICVFTRSFLSNYKCPMYMYTRPETWFSRKVQCISVSPLDVCDKYSSTAEIVILMLLKAQEEKYLENYHTGLNFEHGTRINSWISV